MNRADSIGRKIKQLRKENAMTLEDVARHLGVTRATAQRYESETIKIPSDKIEQLAELFMVSPGYFFGWNERKTLEQSIRMDSAEEKLFRIYRSLTDEGKRYLSQQAEIALKLYGGDLK